MPVESQMSVSEKHAGAESLSFEGIGMVFPDGTEAIRNVSFTVNNGEFVTVVGP